MTAPGPARPDPSPIPVSADALWSAAMRVAPTVFFLLDREGVITFVSPSDDPALASVLGAMLGRSALDFCDAADHPVLRDAIERAWDRRETVRYRVRSLNRRGEPTWYQSSAGPVIEDGQVRAVMIVTRDIAEIIEVERHARDSSTLLDAIGRTPGLMFALVRPEGDDTRILDASSGAAAVVGVAPEQLRGRMGLECGFDLGLVRQTSAVYREVLETGVSRSFECAISPGRWFVGTAHPIRTAEDEPPCCLVVGVEHTPLRQARDELEREHERYRTVFHSSLVGILLSDAGRTIIEANPAIEKMLGYEPGELIGKHGSIITPPYNRQGVAEYVTSAAPGEISSGVWPVLRKDGSEFLAQIDSMRLASGGRLGLFRDVTEVQRLEREREAEHDRFRTVFMDAPIGIVRFDGAGTILDANPAYAELLGRSRESLIGMPIGALCAPEDLDRLGSELSRVMAGAVHRGEWSIVRADGTRRVIEAHASRGSDGIITNFVRDRTALRALEAQRDFERERYRRVFMESSIPMSRARRDCTLVDVNPAYERLSGRPREDLIGRDLRTLCSPEDAARLGPGLASQHPDQPHHGEWTMVRPDGAVLPIEVRAFVGEDDIVTGFVVDLTERREAAEALERSERKYRHLFEHHPDALWVYDLDTLRFLEVNRAAVAQYGYSRERFLAMTLEDIVPERERERILQAVAARRAGRGPNEPRTWTHLTADGREIEVETAGADTDQFPGVRARIVVARDVTKLRQAQRQIRERDQWLGFVQDFIGAGLFRWDAITDSARASASHMQLHGVDPGVGGLTLTDWLARMIPEDRERVRRELDEMAARRDPVFRIEYRVDHPTRGRRWLTEIGRREFDAQGRLRLVAGVSLDITDQKQREEHARRTDDRLREVLRAPDIGVWEHDVASGEQWWSDSIYELVGLPERSPSRDIWRARIHPDDQARVFAYQARALKERTPRFEAEYRLVRPDGQVRHVIDRGELVSGSDGRDRYVGVTFDVTRLRQAESESRRVQQRLGAMIEATRAGAWECTITGEHEWWSPEMRSILGVGPDEAVGDGLWIARLHPEDRDRIRDEYRALLERRVERCTSEYRIVRPDGQVRWVLDNSAVIDDPSGGPARIVSVVLDVTERRAEEEARRTAETRLSLAVASLGAGVWEWSAATGTSRWSREIWRLLGVEPLDREPTHDDWRRFIHPDERERIYQHYTGALARGVESIALEYRIVRADGQVRWVLDSGRFTRDASGRAVSGVGILIDVTARHEADEHRRQTERDLSMALRHVGAGLWISDRASGFSHWSGELWAIIGREPDSLLPSADGWLAVVHPDDREHARISFTRAIQSRQSTYQCSFRIVRPDGSVRHLVDAARLRFGPDSAYLGAVGVVLDITERIERDLALSDLDLRLRDAEAAGACGSWDWEWNTGRVTWSENQWRLYGYEPATGPVSLDVWRSVVRPEDAERVFSAMAEATRQRQADWSAEFRIRTPDGSERWIGSRARIVYDEQGEPVRSSGVDTDITERKAAQEREAQHLRSLEAQIDRLRRSEQVAGAGTWEVDMLTGQAFWSDNQWRLYGLTPGGAGVPIPNWLDTVHPEDRWAPLGVLEGIQSGAIDSFHGCEFRTTLPDGSVRWIEAAGRVFRDASGRPVRLTGVNIDITARKSTERELIESRSMLQQAQRAASLGAWVSDEDGTLWWSDEVHVIFGTAPGTFRPSTAYFFGLVHPDDRDAVREADARARHSASRYAIDHRIIQPDGSVRWVHEQADVFPGPLGTRMVGIVQDITERKRLEQQLAHAQKMESVGRLAGGLAHDFNNSLTAILGFADLARGAAEVSHARAALDGITRAASHARDLTAQILAFSRRRTLTPQIVNLASLIVNLQPVLGRLMGEPIRVLVRADTDTINVTVDPGSIEQVLLNLAFNARDAMPAGGTLEIALAAVRLAAGDPRLAAELAPGQYVELRVADTGVGMMREVRERCFEPFFSTKSGRADTGAGLGLAMCYGVVRQSGGVITVESEPGRGTVFSLVLPGPVSDVDAAASRAPIIEPRPLRARDGGRRPCVVLVEDNELVRDVNGQVLRAAGYRVEEFADGRGAIDAVRAGLTFDLLLADVVLPDVRGTEVAARIREIRRDVPVLLVSGYAEEHATEGLPQGVQFLQKPFTPAQLTARLESMLTGAVR